MMEILKVNTISTNRYMTHVTDETWDNLILSDINDIYDEPPKSRLQRMLDRECPIVRQEDFDTCDRAYSNNIINNLQGYRSGYNTYLDQFENC